MSPAYDEQDAPLVHVVGRAANHRFGHIALGSGQGPVEAAFTDMGPELHLWASTSARLDPDGARELAAELLRWAETAERRMRRRPRVARPVERVDVPEGLL